MKDNNLINRENGLINKIKLKKLFDQQLHTTLYPK